MAGISAPSSPSLHQSWGLWIKTRHDWDTDIIIDGLVCIVKIFSKSKALLSLLQPWSSSQVMAVGSPWGRQRVWGPPPPPPLGWQARRDHVRENTQHWGRRKKEQLQKYWSYQQSYLSFKIRAVYWSYSGLLVKQNIKRSTYNTVYARGLAQIAQCISLDSYVHALHFLLGHVSNHATFWSFFVNR